MNRTLTDFLNHGILPFVGREDELRRLVQFRQQARDTDGLRAALVIGEAGIGKSRLIESVIASAASDGDLVIHVRLHPESAASLAPLLARSLWYADVASELIEQQPEETIPSVVAVLRRLSRLRPLLLILEDIHLLGSDATASLALLLESLAEETLAVIVTARPVELAARGVLERYLAEQMTLPGLPPDTLRTLWRMLFDNDPEPSMLTLLALRTVGNALAVRSALRAVLASEAVRDDREDATLLIGDADWIGHTLGENVRLLSEGMIAHLVDDEREAAERFAMLGEVFSREAARLMTPDAERLIGQLLFKGIIATTRTQLVPLSASGMVDRPASDYPLLAFSHSLVPDTLLVSGPALPGELVQVLGENLPLYSIVPASLIAVHGGSQSLVPSVAGNAALRLLAVASDLNRSTDWRLGFPCINAAIRLATDYEEVMGHEERLSLRLKRLSTHIDLLRRTATSPERFALMDEYVTLAGESLPHGLAFARLIALRLSAEREALQSELDIAALWSNVESLLEQLPELRFESAYTSLLNFAVETIVREGRTVANAAVLDRVEREIHALLATDTLPDRSRYYLKHTLTSLLIIHDTPEELHSRYKLLATLESDPELRRTPGFIHHKIALLDDTLHVDEALRTITTALPLLKAHGLMINYSMDRLRQLCLQLALDADPERAMSALPDLLRSDASPHGVRPLIAGVRLTLTAMLLGDTDWALELQEKLVAERSERYFFMNVEEAIRSEQSLQEVCTEFIANPYTLAMPEYEAFRALFGCAPGFTASDPAAASDAVRSIVQNTLCDQEKILIRNSAIALAECIERRGAYPGFLAALATDIHDSLVQTLDSFAERSLPKFMRPMLERHTRYFTEEEIADWRARIAVLEEEREGKAIDGGGGDQRLHVQMLGVVEIQLPGSASARIKGSRNRLLLALLVANKLLVHPLEHAEFCSLATGISDDHQQARRAANVAVHRLRELLGTDAVLTDEEIPRLNPDRVEVDLLRADSRLQESLVALREGNLARAVPAVTETLAIVGNDVPFPSFYDDFFEAAREDFAARLRSTVFRLGRSLLHERDAASAERLLRRAMTTMPGDAELAELLRTVLIALDQRTEAERVRRKMEDQEAD